MYEQAREKEIIRYLPLVEQAVRKVTVKSSEYDREDLFNIGVIGLMDAMNRYEIEKKVPFEHYASARIKGTIYDEIRRTAKLSRYKMTQINHLYKAKDELEQSYKREATDNEIRQKMGISKRELNDIYEGIHYLSSVSLESSLYVQKGEELTLKDSLIDDRLETADDLVIEKEHERILAKAIESLNEREQIVLSLYYKEEMTLKEIGVVLDISTARVSQIHGKIITKLRMKLVEEEI